jgi:hypothetical protein
MQLAYVHGLTSMQHMCVHGILVHHDTYIIQKVVFKRKPKQYFGKVCKWKGQCVVCIGKEVLYYNIWERVILWVA